MDPEIKVASDEEAPEIELAPAAEGLETELRSATEGSEIGDNQLPFTTYSSGCIFRASAHIRYGRESYFEPKLVSIGPYYHGRENLKRMEDFKVRCMSDLLKKRPVNCRFSACSFSDDEVGGSNMDRVPVDPFMRFERHARRFYEEKFDLSDVKFVEMLVLDSCFVIRIMLHLSSVKFAEILDLNIKEAVSDLLLLENQIPLFFIAEVYYWLYPNGGYRNNLLHDLLRLTSMQLNLPPLFHDLLRLTSMQLDLPWWINSDRLPIDSDHLLHLYWKISEESIKKKNKEDRLQGLLKWATKNFHHGCRGPPQKLIANATELHQMAGINFENVEIDCYNGGDVEFSKGIMRMPCLKIDSNHTTLLVNLMAFENSMLPSMRPISTYIKLMDDLIESDKDVELLQKSGVVYNTLSSHTNAATFFNDIGNLCLIDYKVNPFSDLFKNVNKYYKSSWNRSLANLRQNFFNSPWAGISVFAGVTLLFLSGVRTYYTVFPKNH